MTNIRRFYNKGNIYFLTHVTNNRNPVLIDNYDIFIESIESLMDQVNFEIGIMITIYI